MLVARHHRPDQGDALALQNASSVASLMLTTEVMITICRKRSQAECPVACPAAWAAWVEMGRRDVLRSRSSN